MNTAISGNAVLAGVAAIVAPKPVPAAAAGGDFSTVLAGAVRRVEEYRAASNASVERFLAGEDEDVHKVALETQRAELAFELFLQVKNKAVQAYQEIMRMQV